MMVKTFIIPFSGGMGPELMPVTLDMTELMGSQGRSKVDWVTVWFFTDGQSVSRRFKAVFVLTFG